MIIVLPVVSKRTPTYQILNIPKANGTKTKSTTNSMNESNTTVTIKVVSEFEQGVNSESFIIR